MRAHARVIYIISERRNNSGALAAILAHARQVTAESPIMPSLKSHSLVCLYMQPYRELCKGIYLFGKLSDHSYKTCEENGSKH